jgi:hypothetical protein
MDKINKQKSNLLDSVNTKLSFTTLLIVYGLAITTYLVNTNIQSHNLIYILIILTIVVISLVILGKYLKKNQQKPIKAHQNLSFETNTNLYIPQINRATSSNSIWIILPFILIFIIFLSISYFENNDDETEGNPLKLLTPFLLPFVFFLFIMGQIYLRIRQLKVYDCNLKIFARENGLIFIERDNNSLTDSITSGRIVGRYNGYQIELLIYRPAPSFRLLPNGLVIRLTSTQNSGTIMFTPIKPFFMADIPPIILPYLEQNPKKMIKAYNSNFERQYKIYSSKDMNVAFNPKILENISKSKATILIQDEFITLGRNGKPDIKHIKTDLDLITSIPQQLFL